MVHFAPPDPLRFSHRTVHGHFKGFTIAYTGKNNEITKKK